MAFQGGPQAIIPIMGMATGIISMVLIAVTVIKVSQSQIGQALARLFPSPNVPSPPLALTR